MFIALTITNDMTLETIIPYILSVITIYMFVLAGNKSKYAWLVGLGNQALWLTWIIISSTWGLLPMNIALWIVYFRNHMKWQTPTTPDKTTEV